MGSWFANLITLSTYLGLKFKNDLYFRSNVILAYFIYVRCIFKYVGSAALCNIADEKWWSLSHKLRLQPHTPPNGFGWDKHPSARKYREGGGGAGQPPIRILRPHPVRPWTPGEGNLRPPHRHRRRCAPSEVEGNHGRTPPPITILGPNCAPVQIDVTPGIPRNSGSQTLTLPNSRHFKRNRQQPGSKCNPPRSVFTHWRENKTTSRLSYAPCNSVRVYGTESRHEKRKRGFIWYA